MPPDPETPAATPEPAALPPEVQAELEAGKAARAEAARLQAELDARPEPAAPGKLKHPEGGYTENHWTAAEWEKAEQTTGKTRAELLSQMNMRASLDKSAETESAVMRLETKLAVQSAKEALAAEDPLYPKYKKEVDAFLADIPEELLSTKKGRDKYLALAFKTARSGVKTAPPGRVAADLSTNESGKPLDNKTDKSYTQPEKEAIEARGMKADEYAKSLQHPHMKDGILIRDRPAAPKFGSK